MSQPKNQPKTINIHDIIAAIKEHLAKISALEFNGLYNNNLKKLQKKSIALDETPVTENCDDYHEIYEVLDHLETFVVGMELDQNMMLEMIDDTIYCVIDCIAKTNDKTYKMIIKSLI